MHDKVVLVTVDDEVKLALDVLVALVNALPVAATRVLGASAKRVDVPYVVLRLVDGRACRG